MANKKLLPPPDDIVLGHKEYVVYQNPNSGMFERSREKRNVYYHPWFTCIAPHFYDFVPDRHIAIPDDVRAKLLPEHRVNSKGFQSHYSLATAHNKPTLSQQQNSVFKTR